MKIHLTSQEVTDWRSGVSGAEEILRVDDHLAECAQCRLLVAKTAKDLDDAVLALRNEFSSAHLTEEQLDDYAGYRPLPADSMQHLDHCEACRVDADDLRRFADAEHPTTGAPAGGKRIEKAPIPIRSASPSWLRPMAAAFAITALGLSAWLIFERQRAGEPKPAPVSSAPVETASNVIPPQYQSEVNAAVESGNLHIPSAIAGMTGGPIQLRSLEAAGVKAPAFRVLAPLATAVVEDTPVFRWTPVEGATYSVSVYDDQFQAVAASPPLHVTEWRPEKPLPRGAAYRWEVRAVRGKHVEKAPTPTEAEARFLVLNAGEARRLTEARAAMPKSPLALGILYANAGVLNDARRELSAAAADGDPGQQTEAARLLAQLK